MLLRQIIEFYVLSDEDWEIDLFEKSVKMSTYLVAFVVSDFKTIFKNSTKQIQVEVTARSEAINSGDGDFALNEAMSHEMAHQWV